MKVRSQYAKAVICLPLVLLLGTSFGNAQLAGAEAGNILVILPHFGFSHYSVYQPVLLALAERGHKLTVLSFVKNNQPHVNYEELLLTDAAEDQKLTTVNVCELSDFKPTRAFDVLLEEYFMLHDEGQESCELLYSGTRHVETVIARHRRKPYDLLITEYFNSDCQLGVAHLLQLPIVGLSSCALMPWYYDRINLPDTPSYVQSEFIGFPEQLNWHERILNFAQAKLLKYLYRYRTNHYDNQLVQKYLNVSVNVDAVAKWQTAVVLGNQHYTLLGSRPHSRQLVEIGGVHIRPQALNATLPLRITQFLENAPEGVIFISWGSMLRASTIEATRLAAMLQFLQQLPYKVIWKWETDELPIESAQFLFVKWAPQLALLCHPRVRFFWSHGGLLGTTEAVHCGKPLLVTPIYGDQFLNAHAVQNRGIGLMLSYDDITVPNLQQAFKKLLQPSYAQRAQQLARLFKDRERAPLQTAVYTVEQLLRHGKFAAEMLQTKATHLHWCIYHSLDTLALLLLVALLPLLPILLLKRICARPSASQKKNHKVAAGKNAKTKQQ